MIYGDEITQIKTNVLEECNASNDELRHYSLRSNLTENGKYMNAIHARNETYLLTRFSNYRGGLIQNVTTDGSCPYIKR
jgi:hypothetical protein